MGSLGLRRYCQNPRLNRSTEYGETWNVLLISSLAKIHSIKVDCLTLSFTSGDVVMEVHLRCHWRVWLGRTKGNYVLTTSTWITETVGTQFLLNLTRTKEGNHECLLDRRLILTDKTLGVILLCLKRTQFGHFIDWRKTYTLWP